MNTGCTRTGGYRIGFRRGWSDWQRDLPALADWAKANGFACLDVGNDGLDSIPQVVKAGIAVGTVDLGQWRELISPDKAKRAAAVATQADYIRRCAVLGAKSFFVVMLPEDAVRSRKENFGYMVESYAALAPTLEQSGAQVVIEGWPGPGALCCTPESLREFFKEVPSMAMGVNYDPSHLLRMGIDPIRFIHEFAARVGHVHGKDTEIFHESLYDFGWEQSSTLANGHPFGGHFWRYTIPGQGCMRWTEALRVLVKAKYTGYISIELEDGNFNGSEAGEKDGLLLGKHFLEAC
ncbi:MAG: sugar phosphate isomerase/epimerase [Verrucomicrobiota bacterium]|nr:sugar phosphate isomerase/epimerase [Verrucomicrobiota bacterium]